MSIKRSDKKINRSVHHFTWTLGLSNWKSCILVGNLTELFNWKWFNLVFLFACITSPEASKWWDWLSILTLTFIFRFVVKSCWTDTEILYVLQQGLCAYAARNIDFLSSGHFWKKALKIHKCRFENLPIRLCSYKKNTLEISQS